MNNLKDLKKNSEKESIENSEETFENANKVDKGESSDEDEHRTSEQKLIEEVENEKKDKIVPSDESERIETVSEEKNESEDQLLARQLKDFHRNLIEASLYAAGRPVDVEELSSKLEINKKEVEELMNEIAFDYLERSTALIIARIGNDRYQMQIKSEYTEKVSKFAKGGAIAEKYLRTLTIIALKQPILKSTIVKLRGTGAYEHVKYLLDNDLITSVKKGRSEELTTTDKYAEMFGLPKDLEEMKRIMITQLGVDEKDDQKSE